MIASTLWAEITISGFVFLLSGAFLVMKYLGVRDLSYFADLKDSLAIVSVAAIAISYILGILAHRLITLTIKSTSSWVRRLRKLPAKPDDVYARAERARMAILQYGSDRLLKEMDYQFNFLALFSQLSVAMPLLGGCSALWLLDTPHSRLALPALIVCALLGAGFIVVRVSQARAYRALKNDAYLEVAGMRKDRAGE